MHTPAPFALSGVLMLLWCCGATSADVPVRLNEIMASNSTTLKDPQNQYDDWIEIHNRGNAPFDVAGMFLSDDADAPTKWRIPTDAPASTTIEAGGFLIVWADADTSDPGLHANFKLSADGGELLLLAGDGATVIDRLEYPRQTADVSYGRSPEATEQWRFMGTPTPGAANGETYLGAVADTKFSYDRGFYDEPFEVTISCKTPDAVIYYSVDGSEPITQRGRAILGSIYSEPIRISTTTCLRAQAVKSGWLASNIDTQTYIFLDAVIRQPVHATGLPGGWGSTGADYQMDPRVVDDPIYRDEMIDDLKAIPSMSLVMKPDDLFGSSGIYSNPNSEGERAERAGSIELIWPDDRAGFQVNCGARIYGGVGRRERKKSFRLLFKGIYGVNKLKYPLFDADATDEFDSVILRSEFNDGWQWNDAYGQPQYARDEFMRRTQLALGAAGSHGTHVHLYLNGLYWGLYNLVERPDAGFGAAYFDCDSDDWDGLNSGSPTNAGSDSNRSARATNAWYTMISLAQEVAQASSEQERTTAYYALQGKHADGTDDPQAPSYLDVDHYIDYMIANLYGGNSDWPHKNYYVGRENTPDSTGFKFFTWDAEWTLNLRCSVYTNQIGNSSGVGAPLQYLRSSEEFRLRFADHVHKAFFNHGPLYVDSSDPTWDPADPNRNAPAARYMEIIDVIEGPIAAESARWGDQHRPSRPYTRELDWRNELNSLLTGWFPQRSRIVLDHFRSASLYPNVPAPVFSIGDLYQHGGHAATADTLTMSGSPGSIWYTVDGSDPRNPNQGQPQSSGPGVLVAEEAPKRAFVPAGPMDEAWRRSVDFDDSEWIHGTGGVGYERSTGYEPFFDIDVADSMYANNASCFIRIPFVVDRDLSVPSALRLRIRYDDGFVAYLNGTEIARRNCDGDPAWNAPAATQNSDIIAIELEDIAIADAWNLLVPGDNLLAIHGLNEGATSSDFLISATLVIGQDASTGSGDVFATAIAYTGPIPLTRSVHVKARARSGGAWSALNEAVYAVGPVVESLRISEIMYHPADSDAEYVELTNIGAETVNLHLVRFTDGVEFTFPDIALAPGEYVLVVQNVAGFEGRYGRSLPVAGQYDGKLNNAGERIALQDAAGRTIHDFRFNDDWYPATDGQDFSLTATDPHATDPDAWGEKDAWRPSTNAGGSPGVDDAR